MLVKETVMRTLMAFGLISLVAVLSGCLEMKDELALNADGSGTWKMEVTLSPQALQMAQGGQGPMSMPMTKEEAAAMIANAKGVELKSYSVVDDPQKGKTIKAEYAFKSIAELMNSKVAAGGMGWEFRQDGDEFVAALPNENAAEDNEVDDQQFMMMKAMMNGFKMDRTIVLPNEITKFQVGNKVGPNKVNFAFAIDQNTTKDQFSKMTGMQPEYRCSMKGITIKLPLKADGGDAFEE